MRFAPTLHQKGFVGFRSFQSQRAQRDGINKRWMPTHREPDWKYGTNWNLAAPSFKLICTFIRARQMRFALRFL